MNPFWTQIVIQTTLKNKAKKNDDKNEPSPYKLAKGYREFWITLSGT